MRIILTGLLVLFLAGCGGSQPTRTSGGAVFEISPDILARMADPLVDLGHMNSGEVILFSAQLRNGGTEPLVVKKVSTSCGCTTIEYEKRPIAPGAESRLEVRFDSRGMWGTQLKLVEIDTSAGSRPYKITLQAEVGEPGAVD
jgi:hypothetical protein